MPWLVLLLGCFGSVSGSCEGCDSACLTQWTENRGDLECIELPEACPELEDACDAEGPLELSDDCQTAFEELCGARYIDSTTCEEECDGDDCVVIPTVTCSV